MVNSISLLAAFRCLVSRFLTSFLNIFLFGLFFSLPETSLTFVLLSALASWFKITMRNCDQFTLTITNLLIVEGDAKFIDIEFPYLIYIVIVFTRTSKFVLASMRTHYFSTLAWHCFKFFFNRFFKFLLNLLSYCLTQVHLF